MTRAAKEEPGITISRRRNPCDEAGLLSRLFFFWLSDLIRVGYRNELRPGDLYKCRQEDESEKLGDQLTSQWEKEIIEQSQQRRGKRQASLLRALTRAFGAKLLLNASLAAFTECVVKILQSVSLAITISELSMNTKERGARESYLHLYLASSAIVLTSIAHVVISHPYFFGMQLLGMKIRVACSALLYRKLATSKLSAMQMATVGRTVNLLTNDLSRFDYSLIFLPFLVIGPMQMLVAVFILWPVIGIACLAGISILLLYALLQSNMGRLFSKWRRQTAEFTDERLSRTSEAIGSMRLIKTHNWEDLFTSFVEDSRRKELSKLKRTALLRAINMALFFVSSKVTAVSCLMVYVASGFTLTATSAFLTMNLMNLLRTTMTLYFPYAVANGSETLASIARIENYLHEIDTRDLYKTDISTSETEYRITLQNVSVSWYCDQNFVFKNLSLEVEPKQMTVILGRVGSGKSSLLLTFLNELTIISGTITTTSCNKFAYCSQEPWIFAGTIKENILFGKSFNEERYRKVVGATCLDEDFGQFPLGDLTQVGENGSALSGGQQSRVAFARALYSDRDIYLLDDPFSSIDAKTAKQVFDKSSNFLSTKTVILVTHQHNLLDEKTQVVVLSEGKCISKCTYGQLTIDTLHGISGTAKENTIPFVVTDNQTSKFSNNSPDLLHLHSTVDADAMYKGSNLSLASSLGDSSLYTADRQHEEIQLSTSDATFSRKKKESPHLTYLKAGAGPLLLVALFLANLVTQLLFNGSDYWLSLWTASNEKESVSLIFRNSTRNASSDSAFEPPDGHLERQYEYSNVYYSFVLLLFFTSLFRTSLFYIICLRVSNNLHRRLFDGLIRAPVMLFDRNPVGVFLNRFSRDIGIVDDLIPATAFDAVEIFINLIGILIMIMLIDYHMILPTFILIGLFFFLRRAFVKSIRSLKRSEAVAKSPLISHVATSVSGSATIRAHDKQRAFIRKFDQLQNDHTAAWFLLVCVQRCFGVVLDWLCVVYIIVVTASTVASGKSASEAGLTITAAFMLTGMFSWGVRQALELDSLMTSVERIDNLIQLPAENTHSRLTPRDSWPQCGRVEFRNVSLNYDDSTGGDEASEPVLRDLNFVINAGEKIGIIGRTGAGKSSLVSTFFRLAGTLRGDILIDDVNISDINLYYLRGKLSVIPQHPVLFKGTLRQNLDAANLYEDDELWKVLNIVQLGNLVRKFDKGLSSDTSDEASFSTGQKQLFCLARAIIKRNKVLIMDEATASVDSATEKLIQEAIKETLQHTTVITVAHRLRTVMDTDRVMVLDSGRIVEFDSPAKLLTDKNSLFGRMCLLQAPEENNCVKINEIKG